MLSGTTAVDLLPHNPHVTLRARLLPREQAADYIRIARPPIVPEITRGARRIPTGAGHLVRSCDPVLRTTKSSARGMPAARNMSY